MPSRGLAEGNRTSGGFPFSKKREGGASPRRSMFPFYMKPFQIVYPLFSLRPEAQMKTASLRSARRRKRRPTLGKKEHAEKEVSPLRSKTSDINARSCEFSSKTSLKDQRSARWIGATFWKRWTKTHLRHRREVPDKSKFENYVFLEQGEKR